MSKKRILSFLRKHPLVCLCTVGKDGKPWGSIVFTLVDDEFMFYFLTSSDSRKYKDLVDHKHVSLTALGEDEVETVQVQGMASPVKQKAKKQALMKEFFEVMPGRIAWPPPFMQLEDGLLAVVQVKPKTVRHAHFGGSKKSHEQIFEELQW